MSRFLWLMFFSFGSLLALVVPAIWLALHHCCSVVLARSIHMLFASFGSLARLDIHHSLARSYFMLSCSFGSVPVYAGFIVSLCGRFYWPDRLISASLASCSFSSGFWIDVLLFRIQSRWRRKSIKCSIFPLNPSMSRFISYVIQGVWLAPHQWYSTLLARSVVLWPDYSSSLES